MTPPSGSAAPHSPDFFIPPTAEELGAMLPHYEISHLVAAGGMGAVYAGIQRGLDRAVAIKILPPDIARDGEAISRFRTEAKAMARLTHPNIPAVYDFDVSGGYCYLVMEYIDGWNVHQLITQGELHPDLTYSLLSQVCDALHFAHQRGIVHGDIKPSNLLVTQEGNVKLADFGLAQLTGSREAETHTPMGTPEYAAPELWQPGVVMDHRADLYSLGCVFYEMLTGAAPQGQFQLPAASRHLDPRVDTVIARCMQPIPDLRYPSAADVKLALDAIRTPTHGTTPTRPAVRIIRPPSLHPSKRRRIKPRSSASPILWLGLLGLTAVAAVIFLKANPGAASPSPSLEKPTSTTEAAPPSAVTTPETIPITTPAKATQTPPPPTTASPEDLISLPTFTPQTTERLSAFRAKYRAEWQSSVAGKLGTERDRLAAYYLAALDKFREESTEIGDAPALLAVQNETDRFKKNRESIREDQLSSLPKLANLQKTLTIALNNAELQKKPVADKIRENCLLGLRHIETTAAASDKSSLNRLYDKILTTPDLAAGLAD